MKIESGNSLVIHLTPCNSTMIASAKIANYISKKLGIPLLHRPEQSREGE
jgi:hypothetical protein